MAARNGWRWDPAEEVPTSVPSEAGLSDSRPHARLLETTRLPR
jgi:hypothetical protein